MELEDIEHELQSLVETASQAEGFTPAVLQELVNQLKYKEDSLLYVVYNTLANAYKTSVQADPVVDKAAVLLGSEQTISRKEERQLARLAGQRQDICARLSQAQDEAESLKSAAQLQAILTEIDRLTQQGRDLEAAQSIAGVIRDHAESPSTGAEEARLLDAIGQRATQLAERITGVVLRCITCAREADGRCLVILRDGSRLPGAWHALRELSDAESALRRLAQLLLDGLLLPISTAGAGVQIAASSEGPEKQFSVTTAADQSDCEAVEAALLHAIRFILEDLLQGEAALLSVLGTYLWPQVAAARISHRLQPSLSQEGEATEAFEAAAEPLLELERQLSELGLTTSVGSLAKLPVHAFVRRARDAGQRRRRLELAESARKLLMAPERSTLDRGIPLPPPGGVDDALDWGGEGAEAPLLARGCYQISGTGSALADLLRAAFREASCSGSATAWSAAVAGCSDVAALVAAVPPAAQRRELQVPQLAALHYTDCHHLAELLLTLPHCCSPGPGDESALDSLACEARRLRAAGQQILNDVAERHAVEAVDLLEGAGGFVRVHTAQQGIKARKAVQQALHLIRSCGAAVVPVLPPHAAVSFGATVIGAAASKAVGDLMSIEDISVKESEDLPRILGPLAQEPAAAFAAAASRRASGDLEPTLLEAAVAKSTPVLGKLKVLVELLSVRLAEIQSRWRAGELQACGVSRAEAQHLVEALFEDTDARQAALHDIQTR